MKAPAPDSERCVAMLARGDRGGTRCTRSGSGSPQLCEQHRESGAVIPDDWTSPDNLPVWHVAGRLGGLTVVGVEQLGNPEVRATVEADLQARLYQAEQLVGGV